jgi:pimeloyl-ACP methyl ester carboxylesterase
MTARESQQISGSSVNSAQHLVRHGDVELFVWEKFVDSPQSKPVLVLAHGSATAGRESFDLQVSGLDDVSLMDVLARRGFDVFALDVRGFGRSTRPEPHLRTEEAALDLQAVVDQVCAMRGVAQVGLLAWSWGTQYAGQFVMAQPHRVRRYAAYAQMHANSPDLIARRERLPVFERSPYLRISEPGWKLRFTSMTPESVNDAAVVQAFAVAALQAEPRSPTGPQLDLLTRQPLVDATRMPVPTLMIHGQYDDVADLPGLWPFFQALPHADKQYTMIPDGGHMLHLQQGRHAFQSAVAQWFERD